MKKRTTLRSNKECPECGNPDIIHDYRAGEVICEQCGLVITEQELNRGPEWRAFTEKEKQARTRVSTGIDLPTQIGPYHLYASRKKISISDRRKMRRLRKWQARSRYFSSVNRNLRVAESEINRLSDLLHTPQSAKELAMVIYRKSLEKNLVRGRSIDTMVAAAVALACRQLQIPRDLSAVAEKSRGDKKEVARNFRLILRKLEMRNPVPDLSIFIKKVGGNLGLSVETQEIAFRILKQAQEKRATAGKDPRGLAASALYIACLENDEKRTQKIIADEAGVTEVTIRNRYKDLKKILKEVELDKPTLLTTEQITQDIEVPLEAET